MDPFFPNSVLNSVQKYTYLLVLLFLCIFIRNSYSNGTKSCIPLIKLQFAAAYHFLMNELTTGPTFYPFIDTFIVVKQYTVVPLIAYVTTGN